MNGIAHVYILCPYLMKTGGPEALHQLCDALSQLGVDASIWYTLESDLDFIKQRSEELNSGMGVSILDRSSKPQEYERYDTRAASNIFFSKDALFVFPESLVHWVPYFKAPRVLVWWLSVDNALHNLSMKLINLNLLRAPRIRHAYQSTYAQSFLSSIGIGSADPLSDFTIIPGTSRADRKLSIAINGGHKVLFDIASIKEQVEHVTKLPVRIIRGVSQEAVFNILDESFLYIDLGNFPGKDRMPREAIARDCVPIVLKSGGFDFGLPDYLVINQTQLKALPMMCHAFVESHDQLLTELKSVKTAICLERVTFFKEVANIFDSNIPS